MNLTIKTLKGSKFTITVDPSDKVSTVKCSISSAQPDLPSESMKLIHSGKVLKDDDEIGSCGIGENDFLVVMVAKAKKAPAAPAPAPEAAAPAAPPAPVAAAPQPSEEAAATSTSSEFPAEVVENLKALGFPESEVMACLRASNGNPDVAVEFLMNGIPPAASAQPAAAAAASTTSSLDALRNHPQFNDLRRLVQSNPSTLQTVLAQIGQQQPDLLRAINENQAEFLRMMNEPVSAADTTTTSTAPSSSSNIAANMPNPFAMDPSQLPALLSSMPPAELSSMAQMMGMTVEQLQQTSQMISQMPPEEYAQYMNMAAGIRGMDMGNIANLMSGGAGGGGGQVLRLNEEEMAAVNRLTEMGFDRTEAAQAYLACDKNEALAANLLMDGGFGGMGGDYGGEGDGGEGEEDGDMYD